jgi:hypothetical protein
VIPKIDARMIETATGTDSANRKIRENARAAFIR